MAILLSQVVTQFGNQYIAGSADASRLRNRLFRSEKATEATCTVQSTTDTLVRSVIVNGTEVLQAYQTPFTDKGNQDFIPNSISLFQQKIDLKLQIDGIESTWLGFLAGTNPDRSTWTLPQYLLEGIILPKKDEDYELQAIYNGTYLTPTPGVAGLAINSMNGFKTVIDTGKLSVINPMLVIPSGAWSTVPLTFVTQVETWAAAIPVKYRGLPLLIRMSEDLAIRYRQGKRLKYNMNYAQINELSTIEDFPNIKIVGLPSMAGSQRIWAATVENTRVYTKRKTDGIMMKEFTARELSIYTDWWIGVGFLDNNEVFVNDL